VSFHLGCLPGKPDIFWAEQIGFGTEHIEWALLYVVLTRYLYVVDLISMSLSRLTHHSYSGYRYLNPAT
jgi:hypothetical protein